MMTTHSLTAAGSLRMSLMLRARSWRSLTAGLRARAVSPRCQTAFACFGTLPAKEQMVVKGLAASLPCLPVAGAQGR